MLIVAFLLLAASGEMLVAVIDFEAVESGIRAEKWAEAKRELHRGVRRTIQEGGAMDGEDLMRAVRYRALIEAGQGNQDLAAWWWHAGLNLRSQGAEEALALLKNVESAKRLQAIQVRPREPPQDLKLPKPKRKRPEMKTSSLQNLAYDKLRGSVKIEVKFGEKGDPREPLIMEATVPSAGIYTALDQIGGTRIPMDWRRNLDGKEYGFLVIFRGSS